MARKKFNDRETYLMELRRKNPMLFNMAVAHLLDKGWSAMDEKHFPKEEIIRREIEKAEKEAEARGAIYMLTPDFVVDLWNMSREIAETVSPWQFLEFCSKANIF